MYRMTSIEIAVQNALGLREWKRHKRRPGRGKAVSVPRCLEPCVVLGDWTRPGHWWSSNIFAGISSKESCQPVELLGHFNYM